MKHKELFWTIVHFHYYLERLHVLCAWTNWLRQYHKRHTVTPNTTVQSFLFVIFIWLFRLQAIHARRSKVKKVWLVCFGSRASQIRLESTQSLTAWSASSLLCPHRMQELSVITCLRANSSFVFSLLCIKSHRKQRILWGPCHFHIRLQRELFSFYKGLRRNK